MAAHSLQDVEARKEVLNCFLSSPQTTAINCTLNPWYVSQLPYHILLHISDAITDDVKPIHSDKKPYQQYRHMWKSDISHETDMFATWGVTKSNISWYGLPPGEWQKATSAYLAFCHSVGCGQISIMMNCLAERSWSRCLPEVLPMSATLTVFHMCNNMQIMTWVIFDSWYDLYTGSSLYLPLSVMFALGYWKLFQ